MYSLILGENNAADQTRLMQEQMSGAAMAMQQDPQKAFKVNVVKQIESCLRHAALFFLYNLVFIRHAKPIFGREVQLLHARIYVFLNETYM